MDADLASFGHWFSVYLVVHVWKVPVSGKDVKQRSTLALDTMCSSARTSYGSFTAPLAMTTMLLPWLHVSSSPGSIRWMISIHSSYFWIPELIWFRVTCPNKLISNTQATVGWPEYIHSYWWTYRWSALVYQTVGTTALRKQEGNRSTVSGWSVSGTDEHGTHCHMALSLNRPPRRRETTHWPAEQAVIGEAISKPQMPGVLFQLLFFQKNLEAS